MNINIETKEIGEVTKFWGDKMPILAMEEAGELIQAISKIIRKDDRYLENDELRANLVEEIRDMYISLMTLQYYYGITTPEIEELIEEKLNRKYE